MKSLGNYLYVRMTEPEVIRFIVDRIECHAGNLDIFWETTNASRRKIEKINSYYIATEIPREKLGLPTDQKPGDIDVLIIPATDEKVYFEYTAAFEVKIVRPTNRNIKKNSCSLGVTQTYGLIDDGFPLVGLLHVCMNAPILPEGLQTLPLHDELGIREIVIDTFPLYSVNLQYQRILKSDLPKYVGVKVISLSFSSPYESVSYRSSEFDHYQYGYFNPHERSETINGIRNHFIANRDCYVRKVSR